MSVQLKPGIVAWVPLAELEPDPTQPRKEFPEKRLRELEATMVGDKGEPTIDYPLLIRVDGKRKLIHDGECRWRAAKLGKRLKKLPCLLKQGAQDPIERAASQIVISEQRAPLSTMDIAEFLVDLRKREKKSTNELLAAIAKKGVQLDPSRVERLIQITELPPWAKKLLREGRFTESHAVELLPLIGYPTVLEELKERIEDEIEWKGQVTVKELHTDAQNAFFQAGRDLNQTHGPEEHRRIFPIEPCRKCEFYKKVGGKEICLNLAEFDKKQKAALVLKANQDAERQAKKAAASKKPGARENPDPTQVEPFELPTAKARGIEERIVVLKGLRNRPHRELAGATFDTEGCAGCPHRHTASHDGKADGAEDHCFHLPCFEHKTNADKRFLSRKEKLREYLEAWLRPTAMREAPKRLGENQTYALVLWMATGFVDHYSKWYSGQMHQKGADDAKAVLQKHRLFNLEAFLAPGQLPDKLEDVHWNDVIQAGVRTMTRDQLRWFAQQILAIDPSDPATLFRIDETYLNLKRKSELIDIAKKAQVEKVDSAGVKDLKAALLEAAIVERIGVPKDFLDLYHEAFEPQQDLEDELADGLGEDDSICIGCGCTMMDACEGGCSWLMEGHNDDGQAVGVCSECPSHLKRFKAYDFSFAPAAMDRIQSRRDEAQLEKDMPPPSAELQQLETSALDDAILDTPAPQKKAKRKKAAA